MHAFSGSYALLASIPVWMLLAAILFIPFNVVWMGRGIIEGFEYNISWSSQQGDFALAIFICIGASILQSGSAAPARNWDLLATSLGVVICFACMSSYLTRLMRDTIMDAYHNIVVVPMFMWLLILTLPLVYGHGTIVQKAIGSLCLLIWMACFIFDWKTERLQQRHYLNLIGVCPWSLKWAKTAL